MNKYRWYFKINKPLLESFDFNFFKKLKGFISNYRIEQEDYHGDIIISFESDVPHIEGKGKLVSLDITLVGEGLVSFSNIHYPQV